MIVALHHPRDGAPLGARRDGCGCPPDGVSRTDVDGVSMCAFCLDTHGGPAP